MTDIPNYESLYAVTKDGQIWSYPKTNKYVKHLKGAWLKKTVDNGYEYVGLYKSKRPKKTSVHRIVAITFLPNPYKLPEVNHIDGNKLNNNVENLEWCTSKYNSEHAQKLGLNNISDKNKEATRERIKKYNNSVEGRKNASKLGKSKRKLTEKQVHDILHRCNVIGLSAYSICKEYGVSKPTILKILKGETYKEFQL